MKFRPVLCRVVRELLLPLVLAVGLVAGALIPAWAVTAEDLRYDGALSDDAVRLTSALPVLHDNRFSTDFDLSARPLISTDIRPRGTVPGPDSRKPRDRAPGGKAPGDYDREEPSAPELQPQEAFCTGK